MIQAWIAILGSSLQMIKTYQVFILGRGIMGLAFGIANSVAPMFIMEISPKKIRGVLVSFVALWINIGLIVPIAFNFLPPFIRPNAHIPDYWEPLEGEHVVWRELFAAPVGIAALQLLALIFIFKKENPVYEEYLNSKSDSWESAVEDSDTESHNGEMYSTNIQQSSEKPLTRLEKDTWKALRTTRGKRKLAAGVIVRAMLQLSGIDIVLNFAYALRIQPDQIHTNLRLFITALSMIMTPLSMVILYYCKRK